jgi:hypothetical protein
MDASTSEAILAGYLSKSRLAEELGTTTRTIDRWHTLRIGPPRVSVGRKVLHRRDSVRTWAETPTAKAANDGGA